MTGVFYWGKPSTLLDFAFLVRHMLTGDGIKLLDFHFFGHGLFVLGGGVEVTRAGSRFQFNFFAHDVCPLSLKSGFIGQIGQDHFNTLFVDQ